MVAAMLFLWERERKRAAFERRQSAEWTKFFEVMLLDRVLVQTTSDSMCVDFMHDPQFSFLSSFVLSKGIYECLYVFRHEFRNFTDSV